MPPPSLTVPASAPAPPSHVATPDPGPAPPLLVTPLVAAEPFPTEESDIHESSVPGTASVPEAPAVEIEIEDGEIETDLDRVRPHDGHVRLRIRSDRFVVVEVEDHDGSWSVPAGGEALIEFDALSTKGFKLKLSRRKGVLVLRLRD